MRSLAWIAPLAFLVSVACSSSDDDAGLTAPVVGSGGATAAGSGGTGGTAAGTGATGGSGPACVAGKQEECACLGGAKGVQACKADGTGFEPCQCGSGDPGGNGGTGGADGDGGEAGTTAGGAAGSAPVNPDDVDGDGFTIAAGDCDDADALVGPGSFEVPGNGKDDDCNGAADEPAEVCDAGLAPSPGSAIEVARSLGLCKHEVAVAGAAPELRLPGVIAAAFSDISGAFLMSPPKSGANPALQLGTLPDFGPSALPREGSSLFAISSGVARASKQEGAVDTCSGPKTFASTNKYPPGFPKKGDCGSTGTPNDGIAVDLKLRVPMNAKSFRVRFKFLTCEFPLFVCQQYNDVFALLMSPSPLLPGDPMADGNNASANVAFEVSEKGTKNVIGVNNTSFITACKPGAKAQYKNCEGDTSLAGTGFEGHAGSAWLETSVPIPELPAGADRVIDLRFAIWDSADQALDSTALVDGFEWSAEGASGTTTVIAP